MVAKGSDLHDFGREKNIHPTGYLRPALINNEIKMGPGKSRTELSEGQLLNQITDFT